MNLNLLLLFFLLAGIIVGSLLASLTAGIPWLSWLSYGKSVGISTQSPLYLDFSVLQLAFGLVAEDGKPVEGANFGLACPVTEKLCQTVISLPMHPYLTEEEVATVAAAVKNALRMR